MFPEPHTLCSYHKNIPSMVCFYQQENTQLLQFSFSVTFFHVTLHCLFCCKPITAFFVCLEFFLTSQKIEVFCRIRGFLCNAGTFHEFFSFFVCGCKRFEIPIKRSFNRLCNKTSKRFKSLFVRLIKRTIFFSTMDKGKPACIPAGSQESPGKKNFRLHCVSADRRHGSLPALGGKQLFAQTPVFLVLYYKIVRVVVATVFCELKTASV
jgi:hypothetical protein